MNRLFGFALAALALWACPASAQLGSAVGGQAANQSSLSGGTCQTSPVSLSNGQQAALPIDCTTHALKTEGAGGGGTPFIVNIYGSDGNAIIDSCPSTLSPFCTLGATLYDSHGTQLDFTIPTAVIGPTAAGSAAANPPVLEAGTQNASGTGTIQIPKIDSAGNQYFAGSSPTGSAPPANAFYQGANQSGNLTGLIVCDKFARAHITSATDAQLVNKSGTTVIYVCGKEVFAAGTATAFLEQSASGTCGTLTQIDILLTLSATVPGIVDHIPYYDGINAAAGDSLCVNSTGTGGFDIGVWYTQF